MRTLTLYDRDASTGLLAITLGDLLRIVGEAVHASSWRLAGVEALGASADELHTASDAGAVVTGEDLLRIAEGVDQVIDGYFRAYRTGEHEPWLILRAVDSTSWDVASKSSHTLDAIRQQYSHVLDAGDVEWS